MSQQITTSCFVYTFIFVTLSVALLMHFRMHRHSSHYAVTHMRNENCKLSSEIVLCGNLAPRLDNLFHAQLN